MGNLLEKVISTSSIGDASDNRGLLSPAQSDRFIDYMWDATTLGSRVRTVRISGNEAELDRIAVGEHLVRLATEAVDDGVNAGVAFKKVSLRTEKLRMDWELSQDSLEDNIEGEQLEDRIARLMSAQAANDIEDLAINGDTSQTHHLYGSFDGWRKRLYDGATVTSAGGSHLTRAAFNAALRRMPRRYMQRRGGLRWFTSAGLLQDYVYQASFVEQPGYVQNPNANPDDAPAAPGWSPASPFGIPAVEVPLFPEYTYDASEEGATETDNRTASDLWLVDPNNLVWGVKREIQVYREFKPKKDTIEYTMYCRVGAAVENPEAAVVISDLAYNDDFGDASFVGPYPAAE